jgi:large subunit ribosomal protein L23
MIIEAPIKTEKAIQKIESDNALVFRVSLDAGKAEIKKEFETLFNVKVKSVRTYTSPKGKKHAIIKMTKEFKADDVAAKMKMIA